MSLNITQNPWDVSAGIYTRTDGCIVYLDGRSQFWSTGSVTEREGTLTSMLCHSGRTVVAEGHNARGWEVTVAGGPFVRGEKPTLSVHTEELKKHRE
jgi:hypothetical protein